MGVVTSMKVSHTLKFRSIKVRKIKTMTMGEIPRKFAPMNISRYTVHVHVNVGVASNLGNTGILGSRGDQGWEHQFLHHWLPGGRGQVKVQVWPGREVVDKLQHLAVLSQHCHWNPGGVAFVCQESLWEREREKERKRETERERETETERGRERERDGGKEEKRERGKKKERETKTKKRYSYMQLLMEKTSLTSATSRTDLW